LHVRHEPARFPIAVDDDDLAPDAPLDERVKQAEPTARADDPDFHAGPRFPPAKPITGRVPINRDDRGRRPERPYLVALPDRQSLMLAIRGAQPRSSNSQFSLP
jgi:hypothetical protein